VARRVECAALIVKGQGRRLEHVVIGAAEPIAARCPVLVVKRPLSAS
jgi:hypothetical protein